ncbi:MAG: hypothetical protein JWN44_6439 [Myxococcales bacterium]|nr:hypothetical protein [Myxococcales bacterium]
MTPLRAGDKARIAMAPFHVVIGGTMIWQFIAGTRTPMLLVMGLLFVVFGGYRLALIRRALGARR